MATLTPDFKARTDVAPSGRQRAYIARLALELLDIPFPDSRASAAEVIDRLKNAAEGASADSVASEVPF